MIKRESKSKKIQRLETELKHLETLVKEFNEMWAREWRYRQSV